jgi:prepilin-type N-terminal cleavage/methylation domain-containing protein
MSSNSEIRITNSENNPKPKLVDSARSKIFPSALDREIQASDFGLVSDFRFRTAVFELFPTPRDRSLFGLRSAFTLIELFVVIAVIAILASLLMPALGKGKARAVGALCLSNNKQMMFAWQMYTDENNETLLFASEGDDPRTRAATWVTGTMDFYPPNRSNWDVEEDIKKSPLWPYCKSTEIWRCPADTSGVRVNGRFYPRVRSMAMSLWVGGFGGKVSSINGYNFRVYHKLSDVVDPAPARTWLFMDQREDSVNWGNYITVMHGWPDRPQDMRFIEDFPASYHHRAGGLSFIDGHAEIHRWVDPRTMPPLRKGSNALFLRGLVPSPNNSDIRWLQERATRKN